MEGQTNTGTAISNAPKIAIAAVILVAGVVVLFIGGRFIKGIGEALGIIDSKEEKKDTKDIEKASEAATANNSPWKGLPYAKYLGSKYGKDKPAAKMLSNDRLKDIVNRFKAGVSMFQDNPDSAVAAASSLGSKWELAQVAYAFNKAHGKDLLTYLKNSFDTASQKDSLARIFSIVEKLPEL